MKDPDYRGAGAGGLLWLPAIDQAFGSLGRLYLSLPGQISGLRHAPGLSREGPRVLPLQEPRPLPQVQQEEAELVGGGERRGLDLSRNRKRPAEKDENIFQKRLKNEEPFLIHSDFIPFREKSITRTCFRSSFNSCRRCRLFQILVLENRPHPEKKNSRWVIQSEPLKHHLRSRLRIPF